VSDISCCKRKCKTTQKFVHALIKCILNINCNNVICEYVLLKKTTYLLSFVSAGCNGKTFLSQRAEESRTIPVWGY
jgi:hypothetical protein